jgi:hypothetical protein
MRNRERIQFSDPAECEFEAKAVIEKAGHFFPTKYHFEVVVAGGTPTPQHPVLGLQPVPVKVPDTRMTADVELAKAEVTSQWAPEAFGLQTKIPDGTQVIMLDTLQMYRWVNKKVTP